MSKWKCEICNSSFENFEARGFDNKIYCPLCYYKKLYKDTELERERLNNIINELEKWVKEDEICFETQYYMGRCVNFKDILDKLQELKGGKNE